MSNAKPFEMGRFLTTTRSPRAPAKSATGTQKGHLANRGRRILSRVGTAALFKAALQSVRPRPRRGKSMSLLFLLQNRRLPSAPTGITGRSSGGGAPMSERPPFINTMHADAFGRSSTWAALPTELLRVKRSHQTKTKED